MFTGIITDIGKVIKIKQDTPVNLTIQIACNYSNSNLSIGDSISCSGICLTITNSGILKNNNSISWFEVDIGAETLEKTTVKHWKPLTMVNLEQALKLGDKLSGHIVTGHIDGVGKVIDKQIIADNLSLAIKVPQELISLITDKGSITIDGISLTVNNITNNIISVLIIPHTLHNTNLIDNTLNKLVNIEVDVFARYIQRIIATKYTNI